MRWIELAMKLLSLTHDINSMAKMIVICLIAFIELQNIILFFQIPHKPQFTCKKNWERKKQVKKREDSCKFDGV